MVWAIVVVAIGVLGVAAWAGTGRLGEMPGPVTDRPKAHVPDGPVDAAFLSQLTLPTAATGYRRSQVDALLAAHVEEADIAPGIRFDVVRRGYDMQVVDAIIDRIGEEERREADSNAGSAQEVVAMTDDVPASPHGGGTAVENGHTALSDHVAVESEARESAGASTPSGLLGEQERASEEQ